MDQEQSPLITIEGDRVRLGPYARDLLPTYARWINDVSALRTLGAGPILPTSMESEIEWFEQISKSKDSVNFTIWERSTQRPIGNTGFHDIDWPNRSTSWGILIGEPDMRGKGFGTEVAHLMLDYAFHGLGLNSVHLTCAEYNPAARRAYAKAGFKEAGRIREQRWFAGKYWDTIVMDCLASEFESSILKDVFSVDVERTR